jgi:hypothetical protein
MVVSRYRRDRQAKMILQMQKQGQSNLNARTQLIRGTKAKASRTATLRIKAAAKIRKLSLWEELNRWATKT